MFTSIEAESLKIVTRGVTVGSSFSYLVGRRSLMLI